MYTVTKSFICFLIIVFNSIALSTNAETLDTLVPEESYGSTVRYGIYRNGKPVGAHEMRFSRKGERLVVSLESNIVVTVLKVPVFRFSYRCEEQWQKGQLLSVSSEIRENKKTKKASLTTTDAIQTLTDIDGNSSTVDLNFSSNHWHPGVTQANSLFNTLTGRANQYQLTKIGEETLTVSDTSIEATRYRYSEQLDSDVWYDNKGRWVKLQFAADDGSVIEYLLAEPFSS